MSSRQRKKPRHRGHKKAATPIPSDGVPTQLQCTGNHDITSSPQHNNDESSSNPPSKRLKHHHKLTLMKPQDMSSANNFSPVQMLSNDTLANILFGGFIDQTPRQLAKIVAVNKRFKLVAEKALTSLDLRKATISKTLLLRYPNLTDVDFSNNSGPVPLLHSIPVRDSMRGKLKTLQLRGTKVRDQQMLKFFDTSLYWNLPLEMIDLSGTMITDFTAFAIAHCCPQLKILKLSMCRRITDRFIEYIPKLCPKLEVLDVSMCSITSNGCRSLFYAQALREVDISACPGLNGHAIQGLITGEILDDKDGSNDVNCLDAPEIQRKRDGVTSRLVSISAQYMTDMDSSVLDLIAVHAPQLRRLDLRHNQVSSNTDLSLLKLGLRRLRQNGVQVAFSRSIGNSAP